MLCDYHIHSTYCDGKSSLKESIEKAIEKNMSIIGFSGHSFIPNVGYCMSQEAEEQYLNDISRLKEEYKDKITVLCGIEKDFYSPTNENKFDYVIGSVHYIFWSGRFHEIDRSAINTQTTIDEYFSSDPMRYCEVYYETVADLFNNVKADIIGHFDLLTKFSERGVLADLSSSRYRNAWSDAVDSLLKHNVPFEINTGAMSRGYRSSPYPSAEMLRYIAEKGGSIIITSDSHDASKLCFEFDKAKEIASACGFRSRMIITEKGTQEIAL